MKKTWDGGPAFPQERTLECGSIEECEGLSMRDYFAAHAPNCPESFKPRKGDLWNIAIWRYMYADTMIKARSEYYD
jgi:hypothetical protein